MDSERNVRAQIQTFCLKLLIGKEWNIIWKSFVFYRLRKSIRQFAKILFDILRSRNILDTLLKATVGKHTQKKIVIKFNSKLSKLDEINNNVCEGCPLSPTLFNIHLD